MTSGRIARVTPSSPPSHLSLRKTWPALWLAFGLGALFGAHAALPPARDSTFQTPEMDGLPNAAILLPSGKILIGGNFANIGGVPRPALARLNADGTLDTTFTPPVPAIGAFGKPVVNDLAVLADGRIIAAGTASFRTTGVVRPTSSASRPTAPSTRRSTSRTSSTTAASSCRRTGASCSAPSRPPRGSSRYG